jgi:hypothetical protein
MSPPAYFIAVRFPLIGRTLIRAGADLSAWLRSKARVAPVRWLSVARETGMCALWTDCGPDVAAPPQPHRLHAVTREHLRR